MSNIKILIVESAPVNTLSSSAIKICEVAPLAHEPRYDPVEDTTSVAIPLFACAESFEGGGSLGNNVSVQTEFNTTKWLSIGSNVKVDGIGDFSRCGSSCAAEDVCEEVEDGGNHVQVVVDFAAHDLMFG